MTVRQAVKQWAGKDKRPHGGFSILIMHELGVYVNKILSEDDLGERGQ